MRFLSGRPWGLKVGVFFSGRFYCCFSNSGVFVLPKPPEGKGSYQPGRATFPHVYLRPTVPCLCLSALNTTSSLRSNTEDSISGEGN